MSDRQYQKLSWVELDLSRQCLWFILEIQIKNIECVWEVIGDVFVVNYFVFSLVDRGIILDVCQSEQQIWKVLIFCGRGGLGWRFLKIFFWICLENIGNGNLKVVRESWFGDWQLLVQEIQLKLIFQGGQENEKRIYRWKVLQELRESLDDLDQYVIVIFLVQVIFIDVVDGQEFKRIFYSRGI